jgi:hypothetical protein
VDAAAAGAGHNTGNYQLAVQFGPVAQTLPTLTSGTLSVSQPTAGGSLCVTTTELIHIVLSAAGTVANTGVQLTIVDSTGRVAASLTAPAGQPVSLTALLSAGVYQVRLAAVAGSGQPVPTVNYTLQGVGVSDPIGPEADNPSASPSPTPTTTKTAPTTTSTTTSSTTTSSSTTKDTSTTSSSSSSSTTTDPTTSPDPSEDDSSSLDYSSDSQTGVSSDTTTTNPYQPA